ncbi:MAG: hypothetical protein ACYSXF_09125 [Planctomycetota bacterium]|jgi:hypothetical protein
MNTNDKPPASEATAQLEPRRSLAARVMSRPLSRTFIALFAGAAVLLVYKYSVPFRQVSLGIEGLVLAALPVMVVLWVARLGAFIVAGMTGPPGLGGLRQRWLRWSCPLLITVAVSVILSLDAPFRLRFALSRGAMDQFVAQIQGAPQAARVDQRVGLFTVQMVHVQDDGEIDLSVKGPFGGTCPGALAHRQTPPPPNPPMRPFFGTGSSFYDPIDGPWYRVIYLGI